MAKLWLILFIGNVFSAELVVSPKKSESAEKAWLVLSRNLNVAAYLHQVYSRVNSGQQEVIIPESARDLKIGTPTYNAYKAFVSHFSSNKGDLRFNSVDEVTSFIKAHLVKSVLSSLKAIKGEAETHQLFDASVRELLVSAIQLTIESNKCDESASSSDN